MAKKMPAPAMVKKGGKKPPPFAKGGKKAMPFPPKKK
jgi:hypothetical protein